MTVTRGKRTEKGREKMLKHHRGAKGPKSKAMEQGWKTRLQHRASPLFLRTTKSCLNTAKARRKGIKKRREKKNVQHRAFPRGPPPQYYLGPLLLNFAVRMGSGGFSRV
jgi:hypothetical protein